MIRQPVRTDSGHAAIHPMVVQTSDGLWSAVAILNGRAFPPGRILIRRDGYRSGPAAWRGLDGLLYRRMLSLEPF